MRKKVAEMTEEELEKARKASRKWYYRHKDKKLAKKKARYHANPEVRAKNAEYGKKHRLEHPEMYERYSDKGKKRRAALKEKNKDKIAAAKVASKAKARANRLAYELTPYRRNYKANRALLRLYNVTLLDTYYMFLRQAGKCGVCGEELRANRRMIHLDHDHATNKVREILCPSCNLQVARYEKTGACKKCENLVAAYLRKHSPSQTRELLAA